MDALDFGSDGGRVKRESKERYATKPSYSNQSLISNNCCHKNKKMWDYERGWPQGKPPGGTPHVVSQQPKAIKGSITDKHRTF